MVANRFKDRLLSGRTILTAYTLMLMLFILAPIVVVVVVSFTSASFISFPMKGLSFRWYVRMYEYAPFLDSLWVSIKLGLLSSLFGIVLGVPAALVLAKKRGKLVAGLTTFLLAPISIPGIVLGFALLYFLSMLTLGVSFLSLLIAHTVIAIPYVSRTVLGVYRSMDVGLEEAASILGASRRQVFLEIVLPLIKPGIFAGSMFAMLISIDNLPISFFFGSSTTNTLPVVMLSYMQNQFDPSIASISTVQMVIAIISLVVLDRFYGIAKVDTM